MVSGLTGEDAVHLESVEGGCHFWEIVLGLTRSTLKAALLCGSLLVLGGSQVDSIKVIEIYTFNTSFPHDKRGLIINVSSGNLFRTLSIPSPTHPKSHCALGVVSPCVDTCVHPADFLWDGKHRSRS